MLVGETSLADLKTRPDYAVTLRKALIGFIEVKAPGKGIIPKDFTDDHDRKQWEKLKSLPNLIYTDGNGFSLWRDGKKIDAVHFTGDVRTAGAKLACSSDIHRLFTDFFSWQPIAPRNPRQLAETSARLCRLLRDEVAEQLERGAKGLSDLREDWRTLLFPDATDEEFADGYAQSVTFGLLMARARGISLAEGPDHAAKLLRKSNSLIGAALGVLTDEADQEKTLKTSLATLTRVLDVIDWSKISKGDPEAWLYFYELFLKEYDNALRKKTGSYYTPPEVVTAMVRLADEALKSRFGERQGFASANVKVADPAVGTGTFLLGVLKSIADAAIAEGGEGMVAGAIEAALKRMIGFELQFGPFAVAQLRLLAEIAELTGRALGDTIDADLRLFVADTLADPDEGTAWIPSSMKAIAESRKAANAIKRKEPITVVIGNPPYKVEAIRLGGWVADRGDLPAPIDDWKPPIDWGVGAHGKHLHNLYVYFWRWAAWKVFGGDPFHSGSDHSEAKFSDERGVICFITAAGFLNGPGFQKMRAELRRQADEIWVIDCTPEGHQPPVNSRLFQGVQQPVCIVIALRNNKKRDGAPAVVRFRALPEGHRETVKFKALGSLSLDAADWQFAANDPRASFFPASREQWSEYPPLDRFFENDFSGCKANRTWPIAPDVTSLAQRWNALAAEKHPSAKSELFKETRDRTLVKMLGGGVPGNEYRQTKLLDDSGTVIDPTGYAFRSFDRQYIIPDKRLIDFERPELWASFSGRQAYLTAPEDRTPENGPALTVAGLVPDQHHYHGRGGRVFPLWADDAATIPNIRPALIAALSDRYGFSVEAEDIFAYIAAIAAHPAYTERFAVDLRQPGLKIPVTADPSLFREAAALGREVVWLHAFGERFADPAAGRPAAPPRADGGPTIPKGGAIPTAPEKFPDSISYNADLRRLHVGEGHIDNVAPEVWAYEVSGMQAVTQWFSYRKKDRSRPVIGNRRPPSPLSDIQPEGWLREYTSDLINVLHVLTRLRALEPAQADLLRRIVEGRQLDGEKLSEALRPVSQAASSNPANQASI
ncbi:MAG: type ISP restriction/modification enzyme [Parvularculaceae bacterium]